MYGEVKMELDLPALQKLVKNAKGIYKLFCKTNAVNVNMIYVKKRSKHFFISLLYFNKAILNYV